MRRRLDRTSAGRTLTRTHTCGEGTISGPTPKYSGADEQASREALDAGFRASLWRFFARRVRDGSEIEDMVQEVFARLLKRGNVGGVEHLGGYVFQTASSVLTDRLRKRRSHHADDHEEFDPRLHGDMDFSPEHVLIDRERLARATAVLLELPERTRAIFLLRRLEGMKYLDIAARLNVSVSTVEKEMQRGVVHLTNRLGDEQ